MITVQPHAIWALAWSSKLVSLRCRCHRITDGIAALRGVSSAQMGGRFEDVLSVPCARPGGHVTSLRDLVQRARHNLPAGIPDGVLR